MFGEKETEYSQKQGRNIPVTHSPKYKQSKEKAIGAMKDYPFLNEGDFWILMNETKNGKMQYTGLIISHNACLKINDALQAERRFKPECVTITENGYANSLVYTYMNEDQGLYEVGEVNEKNCKNPYPYAMALKRCFDRVVLKLCKFAYDGIYSDSEADEFADLREFEEMEEKLDDTARKPYLDTIKALLESQGKDDKKLCAYYGVNGLDELTNKQAVEAIKTLEKQK